MNSKSSGTVVIIGAGQAGARTAMCLRDEGFEGRVMLVGAESFLPYERPPLSKEMLINPAYDEARCRLYSEADFQQKNIEVQTSTTVSAIEPDAQRVLLQDGSHLAYTKLVLATGARARELPPVVAEPKNICLLRTLEDARNLSLALTQAKHIAVIGGGLIGLEVAASACARGLKVTVLEAADALLSRVSPPIVSDFVQSLHKERGVTLRLGARIEHLTRLKGNGLHFEDRGEAFDVDCVVAGCGANLNIELARAAGLACSELGVETDEYGQTSVSDIYAVGDVAAFESHLYQRRLRLESWNHAQMQPVTVAKAIVGKLEPYDPIPWAWTDQYDVNLQFLGAGPCAERYLVRGSFDAKKAIVLGMNGQQLASAWLINSGGERRWLTRLIESRQLLDDANLLDANVPLKNLLPA